MTTAIATNPKWNVLTNQPPGTPEWIAAHKGKIGSNDLAVLMGIPRFGRTKLRLWAELTGKIEREDISHKPEIRRGLLLEPVVSQLFSNETGKAVLPSPGLIQHPTLPFIACTPDGMVEGKPIELKSVGAWARRDWDSDVPLGTQVQGQGHAWVLGAVGVFWAAFCLDARAASQDEDDEDEFSTAPKGDPLLLWAEREARTDLQETLGHEAVQFWEKNVIADVPPEPGADIKTVKAIWKKYAHGKVIPLAAELEIAIANNAEWAKQRTALKKQQDAAKAEISMAMGDAHYGVTPGGVVVRLAEEPRKEHWVPASSPRVLRFPKKVGG